jgi:transcriptional regulator with XRE-family HTH domain
MVHFHENKICLGSETVAEQLRSTRQAKNLKLESIAQKLNINYKYLEALEKGNFEKLPKGVYGKNFLREYSLFLGLDYKELEKIFKQELETNQETTQQKLFSRQRAKACYFLATPKIIKIIIIATVVIACLIYLGVAIKQLVSPPDLFIESPQENLITKEKTINIIGIVETESQVIINGDHVLVDEGGRFSKEINLKNGINIITITARKKYGRENTIKRQILVKDE